MKQKQIKDFPEKGLGELIGKEKILIQDHVTGDYYHTSLNEIPSNSGASSFLELSDTPSKYPKEAGFFIYHPVYGLVWATQDNVLDAVMDELKDNLLTIHLNNTKEINNLIGNKELIAGAWYKMPTDKDEYNPVYPDNICEYVYVHALDDDKIAPGVKILRRCLKDSSGGVKELEETYHEYDVVKWGGRAWQFHPSGANQLTEFPWDPLNPNNNADGVVFDAISYFDDTYYEWVELHGTLRYYDTLDLANLTQVTEPSMNNKVELFEQFQYGSNYNWRYCSWRQPYFKNNTFFQLFCNFKGPNVIQNSKLKQTYNFFNITINDSTIKSSMINWFGNGIKIARSTLTILTPYPLANYFQAEDSITDISLNNGIMLDQLWLYKLFCPLHIYPDTGDFMQFYINNVRSGSIVATIINSGTGSKVVALERINIPKDINLTFDFEEDDGAILVNDFNNNGRITNGHVPLTMADSPYSMPVENY